MGLLTFFKRKKEDTLSSEKENERIYETLKLEDEEISISGATADEITVVDTPTMVEFVSPAGILIDEHNSDYIQLRESMVDRTYGICWYITREGWPRFVQNGFFDAIEQLGTTDFTIDIIAQTRKKSTFDLTKMQTIIRTNQEWHMKQGNTYQQRENVAMYSDMENLLNQIQFDENKLYNVSVTGITNANSLKNLKLAIGTVEDEFAENNVGIAPIYGRMKSGFLQNIPIGIPTENLGNTFRNLDRKALSKLNPARNGGGHFNGGIPFGVNQKTGNLEFLNIFGTPENRPDNYNFGIVGTSGSGKSLSAKVKIGREVVLMDTYERIIDPDGEFGDLTRALGGLNINFSELSEIRINPCSFNVVEVPLEEVVTTNLEESDGELEELGQYEQANIKIITKDDGKKYAQYVPVHQILEHIIVFIEILIETKNDGGLDVGERSLAEEAIQNVIKDFGITSHPDSLYEEKDKIKDDLMYLSRAPKDEPTLSIIYEAIESVIGDDPEKMKKGHRLLDGMKPYLKTGSKPMFDGPTYFGSDYGKELNDFKLINFDISLLDEGHLKNVAFYVICNYLWEKWLKSPSQALKRKVLNIDEIIQFIDIDSLATFIETIIRRVRKRNGSLTWIAQDTERINDNKKVAALLSNTETFFFLKLKDIHREIMKDTFNLTQGEITRLLSDPESGEGILKTANQSIWLRTNPSKTELAYAESNKAHRTNQFLNNLSPGK